METELNIRILM